jgi:hypothetical protein
MSVNRVAGYFAMSAAVVYQVVIDLGQGEVVFAELSSGREAMLTWTCLDDAAERAGRERPFLYRVEKGVRSDVNPSELTE